MPPTINERKWPRDPYKGLANYEVDDEDLFAGRNEEIDTCAQLLSNSQTKLLILHGQTGCGKSSFLRAGLIPSLERNGAGYVFLKRQPVTGAARWQPSFIRCGADPLSRIAEEIFLFTAQPVLIPGARGPRSYDVSAVRDGKDTLDAFVKECSDPRRLCQALQRLTKIVPETLVLILDQVEEIITLNTNTPDNWSRFSRFIKILATGDIDIRFVLAIRKDHSGQFLGSIQVDNEMSAAFRTYFLADLSEAGIEAAIRRPTLKSHPEHASEPGPFEHYQFDFAPGVVERILFDLKELIPAGATLPVMQIVCRDLYENVRNSPAPRRIEMDAYRKGGIKGRVKQHLMHALRDVLKKANNGRSPHRDLELKWLKVLHKLVQEEGDGRVHTNVVPINTLVDWVHDQAIGGPFRTIIDSLTSPELLILRQFTVFAPGGRAEQKMFCLGHDMIGIALGEALREAKAAQAVSATIRRRLVPIAGVLAGAIGLSLFAAKLIADSTRDRQAIESYLARSASNRADDVLTSLAYAREAERVSEQGFVKSKRASQVRAALLAGLPRAAFAVKPTPPAPANGFIYPTYPLAERVGFVSFGSDGVVELNEVRGNAIDRRTFSAVEPFKVASGPSQIMALDVSEASPNLLLAMYKTFDPKKPGGVVAFPRSREPKIFTYDELTSGRNETHTNVAKMQLYGVNKDKVILFGYDEAEKSIHLKFFRISESLELSQDVDREIAAPTQSLLVNGDKLLFYFNPPSASPMPGIPSMSITKFESNDISSTEKPSRWETKDFGAVRKCLSDGVVVGGVKCQVTPVPYLQQPDLVVLGLWKVVQKRFSVSPTGYSGYITNLMIVDLNTKTPIEVDLHRAALARQKCAFSGLDYLAPARTFEAQPELRDEDVPTFLVRGPNGLVLGYAARTSAVLVDLASDKWPCSEIYFPDVEMVSWAASSDRRKLMAVSPHAGFVWDFPSPAAPGGKPRIPERLTESCADQLNMFLVPDDEDLRRASKKKSLVSQICS